jgi:hypothetical protein
VGRSAPQVGFFGQCNIGQFEKDDLMDLQQEYYLRHGLESDSFRYAKSYLLFKYKSEKVSAKWLFLCVNFSNHENNPGRFESYVYTPVHDGGQERGIFSADFDERKNVFFWETYEERMSEMCQRLKMNNYIPVFDKEEARLGCWEILLYSHDTIVSDLPLFYCETFHKVLDVKLNKAERLVALHESVRIMMAERNNNGNLRSLLKGWQMLQDFTETSYATWMSNLQVLKSS